MADMFNILDFSGGGGGVFTASFKSSEQTITSGATLTLAHGLGAKPSLVQISIICTSADLGFSVDDEQIINNGVSDISSGANHGIQLSADATNVIIELGSSALKSLSIVNGGDITNTKWKLIARAWVE